MKPLQFMFQVFAFAFACVMVLALLVFGCPAGTVEYEGLCASQPAPQIDIPPPVKLSDEKPRRSQQEEWETGEVKADPGKYSTVDKEKADATAEGMKAAGLKQ